MNAGSGLVTVTDIPFVPVDSAEFQSDPEPFLQEARKQHPWLVRFTDGFLVHGYQANADLLAEDTHLHMGLDALVQFYDAEGTGWADFMRQMINAQRGANHARIRGSIAAAFTPRQANELRPLIRKVMSELLDEWAPKGSFDFAEFAANFPIGVICALLGASTEAIPRLRTSLEAQLKSIAMDRSARPEFLAGYEIIWDFADEIVRRRKADPGAEANVLIDGLLAARSSGQLDDKELRYLIMVLLFGGYDTSKNMLTMAMNVLVDRPQMYEKCADSREFCTLVVKETLRHSCVATPVREVQEPFVYDGFRFPKGAIVYLATPLAGRDPLAYADPMAFNPERQTEARHVAFGRGPHMCIGQFLARNLLEEGLHILAGRLRNPRRNGEVSWRPLLGAWGLKTLPISFDLTPAPLDISTRVTSR